MKHIFTKAGAGLLLIIVIMGAAPRPAQAQWIVNDPVNLVQNTLTAIKSVTGCDAKECGLDAIAWTISKMAIQTMTKSVVGWINNGFSGSPAFVSNVDVYLGQLGDAVANQFIGKLLTDPAIKSPFQTVVGTLAQANYLRSTAANGFFLQHPYTLNQYTTDDAGFISGRNFSGGWQAWLAYGQPQNNPLGAQQLAQNELQKEIADAQTIAIKKLDWGQGFLSWCGEKTGDSSALTTVPLQSMNASLNSGVPQINADGTVSSGQSSGTNVTINPVNASAPGGQAANCLRSDGTLGDVKTPGSVIQAQLNKTLGLTGDQLVTADEFNEIIGALMSQLVGDVIGPNGLLGVSQSSSNGTSILDQATAPSQLTGNSGSIGTAFLQGLASSQDEIKQYQSAWATIGTAASNAISAGGKSCPDTTASPADVKAQADAAATKAAADLAALQKISNDANTASQNGTIANDQPGSSNPNAASLQKVGDEYQAFMNSSTTPGMPSATDIQYAVAQSQDSTSTPVTLYTQMQHIANLCLY